MNQFDAEILENRELAEDCFELSFRWPEGLRAPLPGQFLTVGGRSPVPFLRSLVPVASFHREPRTASFFYHPGGLGPVARQRAGDTVDLLGPRGFAFQPVKDRQPLLIGAGKGIGALVLGANSLAAKGYHPRLLLGFPSGFPRLNLAPEVEYSACAEDGLTAALAAETGAGGFVWAAGPTALLRSIHLWSQTAGLPCQVYLDTVTACAVGACQGCAVATADDQFARVCTEGPVFASEAIRWA